MKDRLRRAMQCASDYSGYALVFLPFLAGLVTMLILSH